MLCSSAEARCLTLGVPASDVELQDIPILHQVSPLDQQAIPRAAGTEQASELEMLSEVLVDQAGGVEHRLTASQDKRGDQIGFLAGGLGVDPDDAEQVEQGAGQEVEV